MALVTVTEAAKLTGRSVKSIYAATTRKKNPLSFTHNSENAKVIDVAELQRVYGALGTTATQSTAAPQQNVELLLARKEVEHLQQLLALKDEQIKDFRESLKLLEHHPVKEKGFFSKLFGSKQ